MPEVAPLRLGVVGGGSWMVYAHLPALETLDTATAVALCEPEADKRRLVAERFSIEHTFASYEDMLSAVRLDGVVIASPHVYHYPQAIRALEKGLHVLVEKPMTLHASESRTLVRLARERRRVLLVDYPWNFTPHAAWVRQHLLNGAIGSLRCVASHLSSSAAVLMRPAALTEAQRETHGSLAFPPEIATYADPRLAGGGQGQTQTTHAAGLLLWLADLEVEQVSAQMANLSYPVDVVNTLSFRSRDGVLGTLVSLGTVPPGFPLRHEVWLYGDRGYLHLDAQWGTAELVRSAEAERFGPADPDQRYPTSAAMRNFVAAISGQADAAVPGDVGRRSVELIAAAYQSAAEGGRPIQVDQLA